MSDEARQHQPETRAVIRGYCRLHRVSLPNRYPVQPRPDLAFRRPVVVATRDGEELLCSGEHPGPHLWPDGDEAGDWPDERDPGSGIRDSMP